jgi:8-oxo-dGTP diphosphatase
MADDLGRDQTEEQFLVAYQARRDSYPKAANTADVALLAGPGLDLHLLLILRGRHPFRGSWALPGGFLEVGGGDSGQGEGLEDGARRELEEETGVRLEPGRLVQLGTYGDPGRDPRGRTISTVFIAHLPEPVAAAGGDDAAEARWFPASELSGPAAPPLAFDHQEIVADALEWSRRQGLA